MTASLTLHPGTRFVTADQGVAAHIGIEWMAQVCGAFAGLQAKATGQPVRVGFLLGTRDFTADQAWYSLGETLMVSVRQVFHEAGMAVFDCQIDAGDVTRSRARLTVFQPGGNGAATP
jgi:predicted hotdog family 3-hydroxylacyl-ACP dehydratase